MNTKKNYKETIVSAGRLFQHYQLSDKYSRDISRLIYYVFWRFKIVSVFVPLLLSEPRKVFY